MAKQTNKTNHILNLLSGNGKKKEPGDEQSIENAAPPVVPRSKTRATGDNQIEDGTTAETEPQIVVDVVDEKVEEKENEELVSNINSALEDELKEYEETKAAEMAEHDEHVEAMEEPQVSEEAISPIDDEPAEEEGFNLGDGQVIDDGENDGDDFGVLFNGPSVLTEETTDEPDIEVEETTAEPEMPQAIEESEDANEIQQENDTEISIETNEENNVEYDDDNDEGIPIEGYIHGDKHEDSENQDEQSNYDELDDDEEMIPIGGVVHGPEMDKHAPVQEEEPDEQVVSDELQEDEKPLSPEPNVENPAPGYVTLNVMETLVDMMALEYMEKFKICTCDRCLADVKALALTKLSGKYVVVDKDAVQPMINFYEKKYKSDIIVELTKACITIDENPHH